MANTHLTITNTPTHDESSSTQPLEGSPRVSPVGMSQSQAGRVTAAAAAAAIKGSQSRLKQRRLCVVAPGRVSARAASCSAPCEASEFPEKGLISELGRAAGVSHDQSYQGRLHSSRCAFPSNNSLQHSRHKSVSQRGRDVLVREVQNQGE